VGIGSTAVRAYWNRRNQEEVSPGRTLPPPFPK